MRVLFDTNIVLDVMLDREPFAWSAALLFSKVESRIIEGFLGATTITTIHYLSKKVVGAERAILEIKKLFKLFKIAPINKAVLESALQLKFSDFEDAVLHEAAKRVKVDAIVTRDPQGFKQAELTIYSPEKLLEILDRSK